MTLFHLIILAVIQGVTEFLPISSSGHLILLPELTGMADQGLVIDVAVHVGTLFAVMLFFHRDMAQIFRGLPELLRGRAESTGARMALLLIISTIPVMVVGLLLKVTGLVDQFRSIAVIGWAMLVFGIVLYIADRRGAETRQAEGWTLRDAVVLGLWQAVALIPGTSRSGITITGARILGFERQEAARLSMLMSIPTIIASAGLTALGLVGSLSAEVLIDGSIAAALAFVAALLALSLMMRLLRSVSYTPYVIYRIILGVLLLGIAYS
ncbi:undecaprenyl-diphosphate phosphatase [Pararhodobacter oceanensis]|uniref:undecaprenyl-diphosphate phosphatase n=1 Tax=Pararhodobacter oceanensis TaxID=2172121 RepID=UPI003A8DD317